MSDESPRALLTGVLHRTGLAFPRGVLGEETSRIARVLNDDAPGADLDAMVTDAAAVLWPEMQPSTLAALQRHAQQSPDGADAPLARVTRWAEEPDPAGNPLARALCVRAAQELAAAHARAVRVLDQAEPTVAQGDSMAAMAAANAAGAVVVEMLELDPEDFADEIFAYVEHDESPEAMDTLARTTGDDETRAWARRALADVSSPRAPAATRAVRALCEGDPPQDPAQDAVWVPALLALVQQAFERALTSSP